MSRNPNAEISAPVSQLLADLDSREAIEAFIDAFYARVLADQPENHRYLLPDVCLSGGRFLDGTSPDDLPRPVEVVATDGVALRQILGLDAPLTEKAGVGQ